MKGFPPAPLPCKSGLKKAVSYHVLGVCGRLRGQVVTDKQLKQGHSVQTGWEQGLIQGQEKNEEAGALGLCELI